MRSFEERSPIRRLVGIEKFCSEETMAFRFDANKRKSYVVIILLRVPVNELYPQPSCWITNSGKNGLVEANYIKKSLFKNNSRKMCINRAKDGSHILLRFVRECFFQSSGA